MRGYLTLFAIFVSLAHAPVAYARTCGNLGEMLKMLEPAATGDNSYLNNEFTRDQRTARREGSKVLLTNRDKGQALIEHLRADSEYSWKHPNESLLALDMLRSSHTDLFADAVAQIARALESPKVAARKDDVMELFRTQVATRALDAQKSLPGSDLLKISGTIAKTKWMRDIIVADYNAPISFIPAIKALAPLVKADPAKYGRELGSLRDVITAWMSPRVNRLLGRTKGAEAYDQLIGYNETGWAYSRIISKEMADLHRGVDDKKVKYYEHWFNGLADPRLVKNVSEYLNSENVKSKLAQFGY